MNVETFVDFGVFLLSAAGLFVVAGLDAAPLPVLKDTIDLLYTGLLDLLLSSLKYRYDVNTKLLFLIHCLIRL